MSSFYVKNQVLRFSTIPFAAVVCLCICVAVVIGLADPKFAYGKEASSSTRSDLSFYHGYYLDPSPDHVPRIISFLESDLEALEKPDNQGIPIGLFTSIFLRHPDHAEEWLKTTSNRLVRYLMIRGLWMAGRDKLALATAQQDNWPPELLARLVSFAKNPDELKVESSVSLNMVWGLFYGSGDPSLLMKITKFVHDASDRYSVEANDIFALGANINSNSSVIKALADKYETLGRDSFRYFVVGGRSLWSLAANGSKDETVYNWLETTFSAPWQHPSARVIARLSFLYKNQRTSFVVKRSGLEVALFTTTKETDLKNSFENVGRTGETRVFRKDGRAFLGVIVKNTTSQGYGIQAKFLAPDGRTLISSKTEVPASDNQPVTARIFSSGSDFLRREGIYKVVLTVAPENDDNFSLPLPILVQ